MFHSESDYDVVEVDVAPAGAGATTHPPDWSRVRDHYRATSRAITINCWAIVIASLACAAIFGAIMLAHPAAEMLMGERRVLLATVLGVVLAGTLCVLFVSRRDPVTLVTFTNVAAISTGFCMGLITCYV